MQSTNYNLKVRVVEPKRHRLVLNAVTSGLNSSGQLRVAPERKKQGGREREREREKEKGVNQHNYTLNLPGESLRGAGRLHVPLHDVRLLCQQAVGFATCRGNVQRVSSLLTERTFLTIFFWGLWKKRKKNR